MAKLKTHSYADLFPMMTAAELDALAADVAENGLRHPVVTYQGAVLDGRNRLLACERAKVEPTFEEHEGDDASALALVISLNMQRRDLVAAQRALVAARAWGLSGYSKGGRPEKSGDGKPVKPLPVSLDSLAKQFKTTKPSIVQARDILAEAPDLVSQVEAHALSLAAAHDQLGGRRKHAEQKSKDAERAAAYGAEYNEAVSNGQITLDKVLEEIRRKQREDNERIKREFEDREFFFEELGKFVKWLEDEIATRKDSYLAWYTTPKEGESIPPHSFTAARITKAIAQVERIRSITFGGSNGRKA